MVTDEQKWVIDGYVLLGRGSDPVFLADLVMGSVSVRNLVNAPLPRLGQFVFHVRTITIPEFVDGIDARRGGMVIFKK